MFCCLFDNISAVSWYVFFNTGAHWKQSEVTLSLKIRSFVTSHYQSEDVTPLQFCCSWKKKPCLFSCWTGVFFFFFMIVRRKMPRLLEDTLTIVWWKFNQCFNCSVFTQTLGVLRAKGTLLLPLHRGRYVFCRAFPFPSQRSVLVEGVDETRGVQEEI